MSPNGGFGGNTGIADAHNIAWKLAMVLRGTAGPFNIELGYLYHSQAIASENDDAAIHADPQTHGAKSCNEPTNGLWSAHYRSPA
jgi:hypothetical protein